MKKCHIAPGVSAANSLEQALRNAGRSDKVLTFSDDLSCGPISPENTETRAAWWQSQGGWPEDRNDLDTFWNQIDNTEDEIVIWYGRHSARELAFCLAWAARMRDRPYKVIDVTGLRVPGHQLRDGLTPPLKAVAVAPPEGLETLFDREETLPESVLTTRQKEWDSLKGENAPYRIVTQSGLKSVPLEHYDQFLLNETTTDWQKLDFVIGKTLWRMREPYFQVSDGTLLNRAIALVNTDKLIASGNPYDMKTCQIRLS